MMMAVLVALGPLAIAAEPGDDDDPYPSSLSGDTLLESVIASFPATPVTITGTLHVRKRRGVVVENLGLNVAADWQADRTRATYTIRDEAAISDESADKLKAAVDAFAKSFG